ncbi:hypothetical protein Bra471DRAFT_03786 [Bradyrhizobium sp. WSM471]|nr:hypothetical protein Bra471DRAFT_03786 [Bradyrhizobium sp. WSM471]
MAGESNNSNDATSLLKEGMRLLESGEFGAAVAAFSRVIEAEPGRAVAYRLRGSALLRKRAYEPAIADLDQAINLAPKDAVAHYLRGRARQLSKDPAGAVADFDQAIKLKPDYLKAFQAREAALGNETNNGYALPLISSFDTTIVNLGSEFLNMLVGGSAILLASQSLSDHPVASGLFAVLLFMLGCAAFISLRTIRKREVRYQPTLGIVWQRAAIGSFVALLPYLLSAALTFATASSGDDDLPDDANKDDGVQSQPVSAPSMRPVASPQFKTAWTVEAATDKLTDIRYLTATAWAAAANTKYRLTLICGGDDISLRIASYDKEDGSGKEMRWLDGRPYGLSGMVLTAVNLRIDKRPAEIFRLFPDGYSNVGRVQSDANLIRGIVLSSSIVVAGLFPQEQIEVPTLFHGEFLDCAKQILDVKRTTEAVGAAEALAGQKAEAEKSMRYWMQVAQKDEAEAMGATQKAQQVETPSQVQARMMRNGFSGSLIEANMKQSEERVRSAFALAELLQSNARAAAEKSEEYARELRRLRELEQAPPSRVTSPR